MNNDNEVQYDQDWFRYVPDSWWFRPSDIVERESLAVMDKLNITKGSSILDCPCGRADMSKSLAGCGAKIVGIDRKLKFIGIARLRTLKWWRNTRFLCMDMRDVQFDDQFDFVINWFNSFGYFSDKENMDVIRSFNRALKKDGRLIILGENISKMKSFYPRKEDMKDIFWDSENHCVGYVLSKRRKRIYGRAYFPTIGEYESILEEAGFKIEEIYDNHMREFDEKSSNWFVIVAKKI